MHLDVTVLSPLVIKLLSQFTVIVNTCTAHKQFPYALGSRLKGETEPDGIYSLTLSRYTYPSRVVSPNVLLRLRKASGEPPKSKGILVDLLPMQSIGHENSGTDFAQSVFLKIVDVGGLVWTPFTQSDQPRRILGDLNVDALYKRTSA